MINLLPFFCIIFVCYVLANVDVLAIKIPAPAQKALIFFACIMLIVFAGGRWYDVPYGEGVFDYASYDYMFKNPVPIRNFLHEYLNHEDVHFRTIEIGYMFLNSVFSNYVFNTSNWFFMILSVVNIALLIRGFKNNEITNAILLLIFVYLTRLYFQYNFIIMRQSLAMAIVWFAIPLIHQKRFGAFIFCCVLAASFHFTAFFFVFAYWLPRFKFSNAFILISITVSFVLGITRATDRVALLVIEKAVTFFMGSESGFFTTYILEHEVKRINLLNFIEIVPFLVLFIKNREDICQSESGRFFFNMFIFYILFLTLTMNFMALARVSSYFIYPYFYIISYTYKNYISRSFKAVLGYFMFVYFTIYAVRFLSFNFPIFGYNFFLFH